MTPDQHPDFDNHEQVVRLAAPGQRWAGIIAIHSTALGPAAGGCRLWTYPDPEAAMADALRLSRGMSYKNALAGLPAGGGKAVIHDWDPELPREQLFEEFAAAVERLGGRYVTAEDVGTTVADMRVVARRTAHVAGLPARAAFAGGDPSPWTALGVYEALSAALDGAVARRRVAVQGLGAVGFKLCQQLHVAGARLVVADVDRGRALAAQQAFGADIEPVDQIHRAAADVFSPNALGGGLNAETIAELGAPAVCGGANNQLATPADGARLFDRGVTYVPDYVANAGGIINVMAEHAQESAGVVRGRVLAIGARVRAILAASREAGLPADAVAERMARETIEAARCEAVA